MNDLRTAAQQALSWIHYMRREYGIDEPKEERALRTALAQAEPVEAAGLFTLAHLWAQQCYFKGLGRPCDIDSARGAFEQVLKAYTAPQQQAERDALLSALKLARSIIGHPDDAHSQMIDAAIAKAEGKRQ